MYETKIKEVRIRKKMSQGELSELMEVSRPIIGGWERGYIIPSDDEYVALGKILNISPESLKDFE